MEVLLRGKDIVFNVQYSKRKKMELEISDEGHVTLKAPVGSKEYEIMSFMKKNEKALIQNYDRLNNRTYIMAKKQYNETENYLFLGRACKLNDLLTELPQSPEEIQVELKRFYTRSTKEIIKKRVKYYEPIIGVKAKSVKIVDSPTTWGTCNSRSELTFNYKLSMAALSAIDYVVIHELCHLQHLNHDRSFWRKVGTYDKDYKKHQEYLAQYGGVMTI